MRLKSESVSDIRWCSRPYICVPRAGIGRVIAANGGILDSHGILQIDRRRAHLNRIGFDHPPVVIDSESGLLAPTRFISSSRSLSSGHRVAGRSRLCVRNRAGNSHFDCRTGTEFTLQLALLIEGALEITS
jgi:hypothetical protein